MKKVDILSWIILISIIFVTIFINFRLEQIRTDIKNSQVPKLSIINNSQFNKLVDNLSKQWKADDYLVYILQPNSIAKTHKELAITSLITDVPLRLEIGNYVNLENKRDYYYGERLSDYISVKDNRKFTLIPIYKHSVIIAEFILIYDCEEIPQNFDAKSVEAQTIATLLK